MEDVVEDLMCNSMSSTLCITSADGEKEPVIICTFLMLENMKLSIKAYADTPASVLVQVGGPHGVNGEL